MSRLLAAEGITKSFRDPGGEVPVLKGISLELARGEIVVLEGPSGSGKTTLLSILGCILTPCSGRLEVDGREATGRPRQLAALRREAIGFIFQHYNLFPALSARENVEYVLDVRGTARGRARPEAQRLIEAVGLAGRAHALPRDLSGGEKQRVAIARALAGNAAVILADEPTANLDSQHGRQVLDLIIGLVKAGGRAALIVTHDPRVSAVADRVLRIADGRLTGA